MVDRAQRPATVVREQRLIAELQSTPTVAVGSDYDFEADFFNLQGDHVLFEGLQLLQVEYDAEGLVAADTVTLSLYRKASRTTQDLVARYSGTSGVTGIWKTIQTNQLIEYFDGEGADQIYGRLTNAAGNSARCVFHILITARPLA